MKKLFDTDRVKKSLKDKNGKDYTKKLVLLAIVGVFCIIASNIFKTPNTVKVNSKNKDNISENEQKEVKNINSTKNNEMSDEEKEIEEKLKDTLENIDGVGKVKVMVYFKGGEEQIPAINVNDSTSLTEEKDTDGGTRKVTQKNDGKTIVMMNTEKGTEPFVVKKNKPEVSGVCVVAEGAGDNLIKLQIHKAVVNLFDLKEKDVNVYSMKK
ncbi:stage III sporulation protein AG [Clostridium massiliodielmoense]|uniref:stage III sporulation protein AG n=1 Tax=Clostridium massiliodielmoense TaxID=1776385 RepID=UPI0004D61DBE|nr:stage III sporulation protein AG [Clostridium massiliodielmoense]KEH95915.1 stage III sporulation protein AG [Clostridium botulinum C/D str. BKT12695]